MKNLVKMMLGPQPPAATTFGPEGPNNRTLLRSGSSEMISRHLVQIQQGRGEREKDHSTRYSIINVILVIKIMRGDF